VTEYIVQCGCGIRFRVWTPEEGYKELGRHSKQSHPKKSLPATISLDGISLGPMMDRLVSE
jgi:hypothetical protein